MNNDGPVITKPFKDDRKIITYLDENDFKRKERAIRKYCMGAYKYWVFQAIPTLHRSNKIDGEYELELPVEELFTKVYGKVKVLFSVKNDIVILENIIPSQILLDMNKKELKTYKGVPYRDERDKFKIEMLRSDKNG